MKEPKKVNITWINRYSNTLDDDDMGRWGITANVGDFKKMFVDNKPCVFELGWIKKLYVKEKLFYIFSASFPFRRKSTFNTVEECKEAVEIEFSRFISFVKYN